MTNRVAVSAVLTLCVAGCGSSAIQKASTNPQVKQDQAKAVAIIQGCEKKANFFTRNGRKAFVSCISPPGKQASVEKCVQKDIGKDGVLTSRARVRLMQDVAACLL